MIRLLFFALIASPVLGQPQLYFDISDGWSSSAPAARGTVNLGFAGSDVTVLGNAPVTLQRRIDVPAWADRTQLALTIGPVRERYTVFVNGQKIARVGTPGTLADANLPQVRTFPIPASAAGTAGPLSITLALDRKASNGPWWRPVGYSPAVLTYQANAPLAAGENEIALRRLRLTPCLVLSVVFLLLGLQVVLAWLRERSRPELFWFALFLLLAFAYNFRTYALMNTHATPFNVSGTSWITQIIQTARFTAFASFAMAALHFRVRWLQATIWLLWLALAVYLTFPHLVGEAFSIYRFFVVLVSAVALFAALAGWRKTLRGMSTFSHRLFVFLLMLNSAYSVIASGSYLVLGRSLEYFSLGGYYFLYYDPFTLVLGISILILLFRQVESDRRQRLRLAHEMTAARSAQQFLLGETASVTTGAFLVDAVYEPAAEVGGDFYQTFPLDDGGALIAAGDVSGKGLKAAMVASMAVALLRSHRRLSPGPLLEEMNRALLGSLDGGFVTCIVARIEPNGTAIFANAGHLPPFIETGEAGVEPGLPLGIAETSYTQTEARFQWITLVSDGIVEASNARGDLFGFERTRAISGKSAAEIAEAARAWGQNDDITVVTVRRNA